MGLGTSKKQIMQAYRLRETFGIELMSALRGKADIRILVRAEWNIVTKAMVGLRH